MKTAGLTFCAEGVPTSRSDAVHFGEMEGSNEKNQLSGEQKITLSLPRSRSHTQTLRTKEQLNHGQLHEADLGQETIFESKLYRTHDEDEKLSHHETQHLSLVSPVRQQSSFFSIRQD